jgi:Zn-dependent peptidase ImmA (M78 family)/transcriptional regulator with XRE-family HTH domain
VEKGGNQKGFGGKMSLALGFIGDRLTQARRARAMSASDLGGIANISSQSISKYENGHQTPRHEIVDRFVTVLGMPKQFFFREIDNSDMRPVFWRAKLSAQTISLDRAMVRLEWLKEIIDYLGSYFDFPQLNLPNLDIPQNPLELDTDKIEAAANAVRKHWGVSNGPLPNCLENIEESGILVSRIHVRAEKVDAYSQWSDKFGIPFIVLSRDKASAVRQRFDSLHELGHILLHRGVTDAHLNNRQTYKQLEKQADKFASFMLLPEQNFLDELYAPTLDGMLSLKERWGVSVAAMIMRCKSLDLFDDDSARRMWMNYARRGWRDGEPYDGKTEKEQPYLIRRSFEMLISEGVQTVPEILSALPFPVEDLEELSDLDSGTFGAPTRIRAEPVLKSGVNGKDSNVVSFLDRKNR